MAVDENKLPQAVQESISTAIAFAADDNSALITSLADPETFDPPWDDIVYRCLEYRRKYQKPPGKEHLDDVFTHILDNESHKQHNQYKRIMHGMNLQSGKLNTAFVLDQIGDFTQLRKLRHGIQRAANRYQAGGDTMGSVSEDVLQIFRECLKIQSGFRDYGFSMGDEAALDFLYRDQNDYCLLGIPEIDNRGCVPTKGELLVFIAARNRGKSFFAHHCGKFGFLKGWTVFHYTLENSPEMVAQRYYQALFSGVKHTNGEALRYTRFDRDMEPSWENLTPNFVIERQSETLTYLKRRVKEEKHRMHNIRIRRFPSGSLTLDGLERDLDEIALVHKQRPDMLIIDSPQLMKYDRKHEFAELGNIYTALRGLLVERNIAGVATHQGNRRAETSSTVVGSQIAGSIDIFGITDNMITYSQTTSEEKRGLARLYLQKVRNDQARGASILITQHYASSQFCMASYPMTDTLSDKVKTYTGAERVDDSPDLGEDDEFEPERRVLSRRE